MDKEKLVSSGNLVFKQATKFIARNRRDAGVRGVPQQTQSAEPHSQRDHFRSRDHVNRSDQSMSSDRFSRSFRENYQNRRFVGSSSHNSKTAETSPFQFYSIPGKSKFMEDLVHHIPPATKHVIPRGKPIRIAFENDVWRDRFYQIYPRERGKMAGLLREGRDIPVLNVENFINRQKKHISSGMPEGEAFEKTRVEYDNVRRSLKDFDKSLSDKLLNQFLDGVEGPNVSNLFSESISCVSK